MRRFVRRDRSRLDVAVDLVDHPRNLEGVRLPATRHGAQQLASVDGAARAAYGQAGCVVVPQRARRATRTAPRAAASRRCSRRWRWSKADRRHAIARSSATTSTTDVEALARAARGSGGDARRDRARARRPRAGARARSPPVAPASSGRTRRDGFAARLAPLLRDVVYGSADDEHVRRRLPLPRAVRQPLPPRPPGEVPRLGARRRLDDRATRCC